MDEGLKMNSFFEALIADDKDGKKCRAFSETEIPGLADRLISGIETEDPVDEILRAAVTETSEDTLALKISKKDFGDLLLVFKMFTNCRDRLAETAMTLQGLTGLFKEAHRIFDTADNETHGLSEVKKLFGWLHKEPINKERVFWEYIDLIMGTSHSQPLENQKPMPKKDAIHYLQKKYNFLSYNAAYRQVQQGLDEWKNAFGDQEYDRLLPENLENG